MRLYPLYHPAAALYTPSMLETLRADFQRMPELLALGPPRAAARRSSRSRSPSPSPKPTLEALPEPDGAAGGA